MYTVKPLNSGHLRVLKNLSDNIERCLLLGGKLKKIVTFETKCFVRCSWHARYLGCPFLGGFTVYTSRKNTNVKKIFFDKINGKKDTLFFFRELQLVTV